MPSFLLIQARHNKGLTVCVRLEKIPEKTYIYDRKQISVSGCLGLGGGGLHTRMRDLLCDENVSMLILVVAA